MLHSSLFFFSYFVVFFPEKFDILIEFLEAETSKSFLHFIVLSLKLIDKAKPTSGF